MSVETLHPQYEAESNNWRIMRDTTSGQEVMRKGISSMNYIPQLGGLNDAQQKAYFDRAVYVNFTGRVRDANVGMMFRKAPEVNVTGKMEEIIQDITMDGQSLVSFAHCLVVELNETTRAGVLVDHPQFQAADGQVLTQARLESMGLRPYARMYPAESIINWRTETKKGAVIVNRVVLREVNLQDGDGEFDQVYVTQYRVLDIVDGVYQQRIFTADTNGKYTQTDTIIPLKNGQTMDYIPFVFFGATDGGSDVERPILMDLAHLNIAHYRNYADYEHANHFTGVPTPVISGVSLGSNEVIALGSTEALVFSDPMAKASFLEFEGKGLDSLRQAMQDKKDEMAVLGARMLASEKRAAEAADTVHMRSRGEIGVLAALANATSRGLNQVLEIMAEWASVSGENTIALNTDYVSTKISAQELTAIYNGWLAGAYSHRTMFEMLQAGEAISETVDYEEDRTLMEAEGMTIGQ